MLFESFSEVQITSDLMQENHRCELHVKSHVIWAFEKLSNNTKNNAGISWM